MWEKRWRAKEKGTGENAKKSKVEKRGKSEEESYINEDRNTFLENAKNFPLSELVKLVVVGAYFNANILNSFLQLGVLLSS